MRWIACLILEAISFAIFFWEFLPFAKKSKKYQNKPKLSKLRPFWPTVPKFTAGNSFGFPETWFADNDIYMTGSPDIGPVSFNSRLKNRVSISNRWHTVCTDWMISSQFVLNWMTFSHFALCGSTCWLAIGIIYSFAHFWDQITESPHSLDYDLGHTWCHQVGESCTLGACAHRQKGASTGHNFLHRYRSIHLRLLEGESSSKPFFVFPQQFKMFRLQGGLSWRFCIWPYQNPISRALYQWE